MTLEMVRMTIDHLKRKIANYNTNLNQVYKNITKSSKKRQKSK